MLLGFYQPFLPNQRTHTPPHQEISHQYQKAIRSETETGNNTETPAHWTDIHLAVSLASWPLHLQIRPEGQPSLINFRTNICAALIALMSGKGLGRSSEPDELPPMLYGQYVGSILP